MYRIYYTDPEDMLAYAIDKSSLADALERCAFYRRHGFLYVTMVSDYQNMIGEPGAQGAGTEYVPQMLN